MRLCPKRCLETATGEALQAIVDLELDEIAASSRRVASDGIERVRRG
jgi:hypothetical protein